MKFNKDMSIHEIINWIAEVKEKVEENRLKDLSIDDKGLICAVLIQKYQSLISKVIGF